VNCKMFVGHLRAFSPCIMMIGGSHSLLVVYSSGRLTTHPLSTTVRPVIWYSTVHCIGSEEDIRDCSLRAPEYREQSYGYPSRYSYSYRYPYREVCTSVIGVNCSNLFTHVTGKINKCSLKNVIKYFCISEYLDLTQHDCISVV